MKFLCLDFPVFFFFFFVEESSLLWGQMAAFERERSRLTHAQVYLCCGRVERLKIKDKTLILVSISYSIIKVNMEWDNTFANVCTIRDLC